MRTMKPAIETPTARALVAGHRTFLLVTILLVALAITACGRRPVPPEVEMTPVSGSVEAPAEDAATSSETISDTVGADAEADGASASGADAAEAGDEGADATADALLTPGAQVVILDDAGARLHAAAAADAQVLHLYSAGEALQVLTPSGDYDAYPVISDDGQAWARVRAADGLVGWVLVESVGAAE